MNAARNSALVRGLRHAKHAIPYRDVHLFPFLQKRFGVVMLHQRLCVCVRERVKVTAHLRHTFGNQVNYMCFILTCGDVAEGPGMGTKLGGRCLVDTVDGGPPSQVKIME